MTRDIAAELRDASFLDGDYTICDEAADEIDRLRARLEVVPGLSQDCDGIACRDETIRQQDQLIDRLRAMNSADRAVLIHAAELLEREAESHARYYRHADGSWSTWTPRAWIAEHDDMLATAAELRRTAAA